MKMEYHCWSFNLCNHWFDTLTKMWSLLEAVIYLTCTRKWQFFGAQLFQVQIVKDDDPSSLIWLAIHEDGVSLLELQSMQPLVRYSYENVVTFGGCQEDFMLVVTSEASSDVDSIKR